MANVVVAATSTFNNKGLKKAKKEVSAFEKQVKTYAKTFAAAFSGRALINYSKKAITAFAADEKAAKSLEVQLRNTGFAFSAPGVEQYIASLQGLYGVLDDELRPAFQQLLTATGSITKSQDALQSALNISAATGRSLSEVSAALTRGFSGNTTGLSRLGAGISKATLKTGDMDKIMAELNNKFAGQAAARLDTYAGKMSLLAVASADAQEIIGEGLVNALSALSDDNSIENLTTEMTNLAKGISDVIAGVGVLASALKTVADTPGIKQLLGITFGTNIFSLLGKLGATEPSKLPANQQRSASRISAQQRKLELQAIKNGVSLRKAENDLLKKKTAVDQLRDKFDLERIGLTAALNAATDDETKLRLKAQLAILDNNEALAKKLLAEMEGTTATEELTKQFYALSEAAKALLTSFGVDPSQVGPGGTIIGGLGGRSNIANLANTSINNPNFASSVAGMDLGLALGFTPGSRTGGAAPQEIIVTVNTAAGGDRLSQAIAESIQIATKNGYSTVPAGQGF
jgi:N-acetylglutamate synthase-like GNAT family acetyltransferase